jgi:hypothetical protein
MHKPMWAALTLLWLGAVVAVQSAEAQTRVGVSVGVSRPGVYGEIHIGDAPRPAVVYPQPVVIVPPVVVVEQPPVYLYVPPLHQQNWRRYCGRYRACGQPVYFVQDQWVRERYAEQHPDWGHQHERSHDNGRHRGWDHHGDKHDKHRRERERESDGDRDRDTEGERQHDREPHYRHQGADAGRDQTAPDVYGDGNRGAGQDKGHQQKHGR